MTISLQASSAAKWAALSAGANVLVSVAQLSVVARYLEPADFGIVAIILVVISLANVFVITGFSDVLIVKDKMTKDQLSTMYWMNILAGISAYTVLYVSAPLLKNFVEGADIPVMVRVLSLTVIMGSTATQFDALMRRELRHKLLAITRTAAAIFGLVIAVTLVVSGYGIWSLIFAGLAAQAVTSTCLIFIAYKKGWFPKLIFDYRGVAEMLSFGAYRIGASLVNAINSKVDQIAIGALLGPSELGFYAVAFNLAMQPFSRINPILTKVTVPVFAKVKDDNAKLLRGYRKGSRILMMINAPVLVGLIVIAPHLVPALLGPGWDKSVKIVQIMSIFVLFRSASNINIGVLLAKEKFKWPLYWNLVILVTLPATVFFVTRLSESLIAVSWAMVSLQFFLSAMSYVLFVRPLLGQFLPGYISDLSRPIFVAGLMSLCVYWIQTQNLWMNASLTIAISILSGAIVYCALSFLIQPLHSREFVWMIKSRL